MGNIVAGCPADLPSTEQAVEAGCPPLGKPRTAPNGAESMGKNTVKTLNSLKKRLINLNFLGKIPPSGPRKEAYSANVKDVLGQNSSALGWALAVGGGAAGLGICGVAGAKLMGNKDEDESDEDSSGQPLAEE